MKDRIGGAVARMVFLLIVASLSPAQGQEISHSTVDDLQSNINNALQNHPKLKEEENLLSAAKAEVEFFRALYRPRLTVEVDLIHFLKREGEVLVAGDLVTGTGGIQPDSFYSPSLVLTVPLFREGKLVFLTLPSEQKAAADLQAEEASHRASQADIIFNVSESFYTVLKDLEEIKLLGKKIAPTERLYKAALGKFNLGLIAKNDLLTAEVQLANSKRDLKTSQTNLAASVATLLKNMGLDPATSISIKPIKQGFGPLPPLPPLEDLLAIASQKHPLISSQQARIQSARDKLRVAKNERYPIITAGSSISTVRDFAEEFESNQWRVGLNMSWNVFDLFDFSAANAKLRQADYEVKAQEMALIGVKHDIAEGVTRIFQEIRNIENQQPALDKAIEQAREALKLAEGRYRQGLLSEAAIFLAQDQELGLQRAFLDAQYQQHVQHAALRKAVDERAR